MRSTPGEVTELQDDEIFVFGSNLNGQHYGGAARLANEKFGAEWFVGEGLTGRSYAFPTLDMEMRKVSFDDFRESVEKLYHTCRKNPDNTFLLTRVGCGIAGFKESDVKLMFSLPPWNLAIPEGW